jgi:hypothetical protein
MHLNIHYDINLTLQKKGNIQRTKWYESALTKRISIIGIVVSNPRYQYGNIKLFQSYNAVI